MLGFVTHCCELTGREHRARSLPLASSASGRRLTHPFRLTIAVQRPLQLVLARQSKGRAPLPEFKCWPPW